MRNAYIAPFVRDRTQNNGVTTPTGSNLLYDMLHFFDYGWRLTRTDNGNSGGSEMSKENMKGNYKLAYEWDGGSSSYKCATDAGAYFGAA